MWGEGYFVGIFCIVGMGFGIVLCNFLIRFKKRSEERMKEMGFGCF